MVRLEVVVFIFIALFSFGQASAGVFYTGECELEEDPSEQGPGLLAFCINGKAFGASAAKSKNPEGIPPPYLQYAEGNLSTFITPFLSVHLRGHAFVLTDTRTKKTTYRESRRDDLYFQIGNSSLSRHRIAVGEGHPKTSIDQNIWIDLHYIWGLDSFEAPEVQSLTYTYDNQKDITFQTTYGQLTEAGLSTKQKLFGSSRIMYDFAALEGTRLSIGGYGDGLFRRSMSVGLLNVNGRGDQTALEVTRKFSKFPYDPSEFRQLIRLSYISREQNKLRLKVQYDDWSRELRMGGLGASYRAFRLLNTELQFGYSKNEIDSKLSHWFALMKLGVQT